MFGPFGELIRATGPMAKANPFRFSTKYQDDETDLLYYGHRYYSATTGRWATRDPLGEPGFALSMGPVAPASGSTRKVERNVYLFASNGSLNVFDFLGLAVVAVYDGGDLGYTRRPGDNLLKCIFDWCTTAKGKDFAKFAKLVSDYQIDVRSLASPWQDSLIQKLRDNVDSGIIIDEVCFIDHAIPGHQEVGDDSLPDSLAVRSPQWDLWMKFFSGLGELISDRQHGAVTLYGCNVAQGPAGARYLQYLADKIGKDVSGWTGVTYIGILDSTPTGEMVTKIPTAQQR
jgi:RHS repeat-associated protein